MEGWGPWAEAEKAPGQAGPKVCHTSKPVLGKQGGRSGAACAGGQHPALSKQGMRAPAALGLTGQAVCRQDRGLSSEHELI